MSTMPGHLRPIMVEIPATWTAEQALAVWQLVDQCARKSGPVTAAKYRSCWPRSNHAPTSTTLTRILGLSTSNRLIAQRPNHRSPTTVLLFDQNGHPVVPTCARLRPRAQRRSRMPAGHRRRRRAASWTAASTTEFSSQRRTTKRPPDRCRLPRVHQDAPFRRGFTPPLTARRVRALFCAASQISSSGMSARRSMTDGSFVGSVGNGADGVVMSVMRSP